MYLMLFKKRLRVYILGTESCTKNTRGLYGNRRKKNGNVRMSVNACDVKNYAEKILRL